MKKTILTGTFLLAFAAAGMAQSTGNNGNGQGQASTSCSEQKLTEFADCLDSKGVSYTLVPSMATNQVYLYVEAGTPSGKVTSCKMQYSQGNNSCATAPAIIDSDPFAF